MHIIKVPAVYSLKLPGGEWLNLALIRRLQVETDNRGVTTVVITWDHRQSQVYRGAKALALLEAWQEIQGIDKSGVAERVMN